MRWFVARRPAAGLILCCALALLMPGVASAAEAESKHLAPGFTALSRDAKIVVIPSDIELFLVTAGGLPEPKADWTEAAMRHFKSALIAKKKSFGVTSMELSEKELDDLAEINALHAAIARSIQTHHFGPGFLRLPTKEGKLDWSMGEPIRLLKEKTGADYALFSWIRDYYASAERVAAFIILAAVGIGIDPGGRQQGYASLVDLSTGRIVWFNQLLRPGGDLREADKAAETLDVLLTGFPAPK